MSRVEVLSGLERRRPWSEDQKRAIVADWLARAASSTNRLRRSIAAMERSGHSEA
jgi:hypothetical protein